MHDGENGIESGSASMRRLTAILMVVVFGILCPLYLVRREDEMARARLLEEAELVADAINPEHLKVLAGDSTDIEKPHYHRLKEQFRVLGKAIPECRFVYLMGSKPSGELFFFLDNEPESSPDKSPPGEPYPKASNMLKGIFKEPISFVEGPLSDEWGVWVSAHVPIRDAKTGRVIAVLGLDVDAREWRRMLAASTLPPVALLVSLAISAAIFHLFWSRRWGYFTGLPFFAASTGLILTFFASWGAYILERHSSDRTLHKLLGNETLEIDSFMRNIDEVELQGLASFCRHARQPTQDDFANFASHLSGRQAVLAWAWIPAAGNADSATAQRAQYLAMAVFPVEGNEYLAGYDFGSEEPLRKALDETSVTGLASCSTLVSHISGSEQTDVIWVFRPAYERGTDHVAGFVAASLAPERLIRTFSRDPKLLTELLLRDKSGEQVIVPKLSPATSAISNRGITRPVLAFGRVFLVKAHLESSHSLCAKPLRMSLLVMLSGLLLTCLIVFYIYMAVNRGRELERRIMLRTQELSRSHEQIEATLHSIADAVMCADRQGRVIDMNGPAEALTGIELGQAAGKSLEKVFRIDDQATRNKLAETLSDGKTLEISGDTTLNSNDGSKHEISGIISPIRDDKGNTIGSVLVFRDISERKNMEMALFRSEQQFRSLVSNIPGVSYRCKPDKDWTMLYMSSEPDTLAGFHVTDFINNSVRSFESIIYPEDRNLVSKNVWAGIKKRAPWEIEYRLLGPDGGVFWVYEKGRAATEKSDDAQYLDGFILDITERKNAEEQLRLSREQFELAVQGSNDGIWDWNLRTNSLYLSPRWKEQLGFKDDELENNFDSFSERVHPEDKPFVMDYVDRYLRGEIELYNVEFRMQHRDGSWRWILARGTAVRDTEGLPVRMAGSHTDITDQKLAEKELLRQKRMQELLTDISSTYISIPLEDADKKIVSSLSELGEFVSASRVYVFEYWRTEKACFKTHEWPCLEEQPRLMSEWFIPEWHKTHSGGDAIRIDDATESSLPGSCAFLKKMNVKSLIAVPMLYMETCCGFVVYLSANKKHSYSDTEEKLLTVFSKMLVNIRKRREIEKSLRQSRELAEAGTKAKSEFLANVSHEIRTPMNGVIGMAELLLDTPLNQEQKQYADTVSICAEQLLSLTNDILDFSKIEAGKMDIETMGFEIRNLVEEVSRIVSLKAGESNIEFKLWISDEIPPFLKGDPRRTGQVLLNLLSNALKFTESGDIEVRVELEDKEENKVTLRFSVSDTGIGIPPDRRDQLFRSFSQLDRTTTRKYGGTGLGLAICKQLVEMMKGNIGFSSKEGKGSSFWFTLPLDIDSASTGKTTKASAKSTKDKKMDFGSLKILVAEDNPVNRQVAVALLRKKLGIDTDSVHNGAEALNALRQNKYDIVFMDCQMPIMDGFEATKVIRDPGSQMPDPKIHIVAMTANAMKGDREICLSAGMDDYLAKPIKSDKIRDIILRFMEKKEPDNKIITRRKKGKADGEK